MTLISQRVGGVKLLKWVFIICAWFWCNSKLVEYVVNREYVKFKASQSVRNKDDGTLHLLAGKESIKNSEKVSKNLVAQENEKREDLNNPKQVKTSSPKPTTSTTTSTKTSTTSTSTTSTTSTSTTSTIATTTTTLATTSNMERTCNARKHAFFPYCDQKFNFIQQHWQSHCFKDVHGVDGSKCSILNYLTKVEPYCIQESSTNRKVDENNYAQPRFQIDGLLALLPEGKFSWMRQRVLDMWDDWLSGIKEFVKRNIKYTRKKIYAYMASMEFQPWIFSWAGKGGPVGELIQWTDLIAGLYVLGHDVEVSINKTLLRIPKDKEGCAATPDDNIVDVIYTDLNGIAFLNEYGTASNQQYKCKFRVLDSFGTYPEFNYPAYPHPIPGGRSGWGNKDLIPTQILTLYPHTQDNSFLGFVMGSQGKLSKAPMPTKKDQALLYAKQAGYVNSNELKRFLEIISEYFEVHATATNKLPDYIKNHGPVPAAKVKELLAESKLFIGVGFPYEGPGPLEAMAAGTPYIQPKFLTPKSNVNEAFLRGKPTSREFTSQNPYMEEFVGPPYTYTVNITDEPALRKLLQEIKSMKPLPPKITKEFTNEGMLERIHILTDRMDFCSLNNERWPPIRKLQVEVARIGQSCKDICMSRGLVCERHFFDDINDKASVERFGNLTCKSTKSVLHLHPPSFDATTNICYLQTQPQVFSCSHRDTQFRQICPCRDYEKEQFATCNDCL